MATETTDQWQQFLEMPSPEVPHLVSNVVSVFIQAIPRDSYRFCGLEVDNAGMPELSPDEVRNKLAEFVRKRLELLAEFEYTSWINGRIPFITSRELQLWRLLQFVKFIWFWDLPDNEILAMIFNATRRKASGLASDFDARFRKTILYPVALRRLYQLFHTEPSESGAKHPRRRNWLGNLYFLKSERYLSYTQTLIEDFRSFVEPTLVDAAWWDKEEQIMWVPEEVCEIARLDTTLRKKLFDMYQLPS